jgi:hypothetical protein
MVMLAVSLPPVLLAVMVYVADEVTAVGFPLMAPVEESRDKPAGSDGETDQEVMAPPLVVGVNVVMAVPFSKVREFELYEIDGATSLTMMVMLAVSVPPVLFAVIVYEAEEVIVVGVPYIIPVEVLRNKPAGSDGETDQDVTVPPVDVGV